MMVKTHKKTLALLLLAALVYAGLVIVLALPLLGHHGIPEELRVNTASISQGKVGQALHLTVEGTGFDNETNFMLVLDSGNQQAIVYSTETFGATDTILRNGQVLYLGNRGRVVHQYDIGKPDRPRFQYSFSMTGKPTALALSNGTPWVASGYGEIGTLGSPHRMVETITDLATDEEGILYAAAANHGLIVFRPRAENTPVKIGSLDLPGAALSIAVAEHLAYVSSAKVGLHVCDISDPENPRLISTLPWSGDNQSLTVKDNLLLLGSTDQLAIIDVRNPRLPRVLAQMPLAKIKDIVINENLALLAADNSGLVAVDITDPSNPFISGHLTPGDTIRCLTVNGDLAYLGTENAGLLVVDLKRLSHHPDWRPEPLELPRSRTSMSKALRIYGPRLPEEIIAQVESQLPRNCDETDTAKIGPITYLASDCGLVIIDQKEPPHVEVLQQPLAAASKIELAGTTAYVSGSRGINISTALKPTIKGNRPGLQIFDVSDPSQPRAKGFIETADMILKMRIRKDRAYLAVKEKGVLIVDLNDLDHPQVMGIADLPWPEQSFAGYLDIYLSGDVLYIANGRAGLHVFDVSNPHHPQRVSAFNTTGGWVNRLAGDKKQLFAYNFNNDLQIYDLTRSKFPRLTGTLDRFSNVSHIDIRGNTLQLELLKGNGIARALPLTAEDINRHGSTLVDLKFAAPVFPGDYMLYAFNQKGRQQLPGLIRIESAQK